VPPGTGVPTGSVTFDDDGAPIAGCGDVTLTDGVAQCATVPQAGTRDITARYSGDSNYAISMGEAQELVSPAPLTVTATSQSRRFGQPNPPLGYSIGGFVNNDTPAVVSGTASCTTPAVTTSVGAMYPIVCTLGSLSAANYTFSFTRGVLTVTYDNVVSGPVSGPLRVGAGQATEIAPGARVLGPVTVAAGGSLDVESGLLLGPVSANGAATVRVCGADVHGPLSLSRDTGPVLVGDGTAACPASVIGGTVSMSADSGGVEVEGASVSEPLTVTGAAGGVTVIANTVDGPLSVTANSGGATVTGNVVFGSLTVTGNTGSVVDAPNTVSGPSKLQ
jgi:hypothetical protein